MGYALAEPEIELSMPAEIDGDFSGKHIVSVEQFARGDIDELFRVASKLRERVRAGDTEILRLGASKIMATLFFEASTRTDMSFQAAMYHLGGKVIATSGGVQFSSVYKGENLADTVRAVACYADVVVLRHPEVGSSYEAARYLDWLSDHIGRRAVLISGGDGIGEHPTQALLDLFTIVDRKHRLNDLQITMVGDLQHGRTVHSLAKLIALHGDRGAKLNFVSPPELRLPRSVVAFLASRGIATRETSDLSELLAESDVIYWTRVQEERFADKAAYGAIADRFIMMPALLDKAKPDAMLLHPLPRKHEMGTQADHDILDANPRSEYFRQMENGMFVRMALLAKVMGLGDI